MITAKTWVHNWHKAGLLGLMTAAISVAAAAECVDRSASWQAANVTSSSEWDEFDASGRKLVHESGTLHGAELSAGLRCGDWNLQAQISQLNGSRLYDGQTSTGVPVTSQSALRQLQGHLQASLNLTDAWQLGGRLSSHTLWRDIASAAGASGYLERYDWTMLSLGAQWQTALGPGKLTLAAWTGTQLKSTMVLNLPGRDQATLPLGSISQVELAAGWRAQLGRAWSLQADVRYRRADMDQGADAVITRRGVPVGVAHQPRTSMVDVPVAIRIGYEF
ncbi:MAG: hypothetical protein Q7K57_21810 [Burkholderiaceae bacterium]|nr:hypothetical protein [Burkholderiaceae bacterium]